MGLWTIEPTKYVEQPHTNDSGYFKINSDQISDVDNPMIYTITFSNGRTSTSETITVQQKECITCTCDDVVVLTSNYNYSMDAQSNVRLAKLRVNDDIDTSYITPKIFSEGGITSIDVVEEYEEGVRYLYIVGSLSETYSARALKFGYSACGVDCHTAYNNPLYVYQRCACGMDNCCNTYPDGASIITEDRALYLENCDSGGNLDNGDSICVRSLSVQNINGEWVKLIDPVLNDPTETEIIINPLYKHIEGGSPGYDINYNTLSNYVQINNWLKIYVYKFTEHIHHYYPIGAQLIYVANPNAKTNQEQVVKVKYKVNTTECPKIKGGGDDGVCALSEFTTTLYLAPNGFYYEDNHDDTIKRRLLRC